MGDTRNIRKDNVTHEENVETSDGRSTPAQNYLPDVELPEGYKPPKFEMFDGIGDPMNLKNKPTETFHKYASRWRSKAAKVRPALEEEQINKFFVRAQDPQYYKRLMVIKNYKFSDIIKLGERIEEGIKSGMVTNFEALQATNKALQLGGISKKKEVGAVVLYERLKATGYVTPIPVVTMENTSQWVNPNKTYSYYSGMEGHTIDECRILKDKIQTLIDTKVIQAKEAAPNVRNNPLLNHKGEGIQSPIEVKIATSTPFKVKETTPSVAQTPLKVEVTIPFTVTVAPTPSFNSNAKPWDYVVEARSKGKGKMEETSAGQGMTRTGRVYTPEHFGGTSKEATSTQPIIETCLGDIWRKWRDGQYGRQVLESHKITFHEDELPPKGLSHNRALHITVQFEDKIIIRVLIDGGSSLNICPLITLKRLGKGLHEIRAGTMNMKAFDGSQRATIWEINLCLQMDPTWFYVVFQVLDISAIYNLLLGRPWIHAAGVVASTLHLAMMFEWNHQEVIIHRDESNPIYTNQIVPVVDNNRKLGGETYYRIEHINAIEKDK
ncbi:uncharacterized protein [Nicotiana sylvestris]|uniref:uncharacterized protein n=1 Tax=Nicotiana sylvestris TaxID=4096 RepID=UPI00388C4DE4